MEKDCENMRKVSFLGHLPLNITKLEDHAIISSVSEMTTVQRMYPREMNTELECIDTCIVEPQCSATFVARDGRGDFEWCTLLAVGGATADVGPLDDNITLDVDLWNGTSGRTKPSKSLLVIKGIGILMIPDSCDAKTTEKQTMASHFV